MSLSNLYDTIKAVLAQVHPDMNITQSGLIEINRLINDMIKTLITQVDDVSTLSIQSAVKSIIGGELSKHAVSEGTKAVTKYNSKIPFTKNITKSQVPELCGLQISIETVETIMQSHMEESHVIEQTTSVYFGAVLEYMIAEILELAGNAARSYHKVRITVHHISEAIKSDEELNKVFINHGTVQTLKLIPNSTTHKIPIKLKTNNNLTSQFNYPHLFQFIKDNIDESFRHEWGITDQQIIQKAKELFVDMDQNPTQHKEHQGQPLNVLEQIIRKYVSTLVDFNIQDFDDAEHINILIQTAILAYLQDGGQSVKWIDYLDTNDITVDILSNYINKLESTKV
jgi:histone H3/H4